MKQFDDDKPSTYGDAIHPVDMLPPRLREAVIKWGRGEEVKTDTRFDSFTEQAFKFTDEQVKRHASQLDPETEEDV